MDDEIRYIHHVGHVVRDIEQAHELYRKLGFVCPAPAYPVLPRVAGEAAQPFGVANMHAAFTRNFVEIMAVVTAESHLPDEARPIPLQVAPAALPQVVANIERTIARISASLARFEGLHILVFQTEDADETLRRFDRIGVGHSGVNRVQQPGQLRAMGVIELDKEVVPEGRLAVAEAPVFDMAAHPPVQHPNGAVDLVESILCVPDLEIEAYAERYQRYLGHVARSDGTERVFDLQGACVRLIPASALDAILPGETTPALPAFVAYAVAVNDLAASRRWLQSRGLIVHDVPTGGIFVPARAALGAAVIFRQAQ